MRKNDLSVADKGEKEIIRNLLEKYLCEFSLYDDSDVNAFGLYDYPYLDYFWTEKGRYSFIIRVDEKIAGFSLVDGKARIFNDAKYVMEAFYILPKYRHTGVGTFAINRIFDIFPGTWEIACHPKNTVAIEFIKNTVSKYTGNNYTMMTMCGAVQYNDESFADAFCFSTYPMI